MQTFPVDTINGKYIKDWLVLCPIFSDGIESEILAKTKDSIELKEGKEVGTSDGRILKWKQYITKSGFVNLHEILDEQDSEIAYVSCILRSDIDGDAQIRILTDSGITIWINGTQLHNNSASEELQDYIFEASLKTGDNICLIKMSGEEKRGFMMRANMLNPDRAVISGTITYKTDKLAKNAIICLEQDGKLIAQTQTDANGKYHLNIYPVGGIYDLSSTLEEYGEWKIDFPINEGERHTINLDLKKALSAIGNVQTFYGLEYHAYIPVQMLRFNNEGTEIQSITTTLVDGGYEYRFYNLKPGKYKLRFPIIGGYVYSRYDKAERVIHVKEITQYHAETNTEKHPGDFLYIKQGKTLDMVHRFAVFKKGTWRNYTSLDGLINDTTRSICQDSNGYIWFGTSGGVSRYDGKTFVNYTMQEGLAGEIVKAVHESSDGLLWFGTSGGVSVYDGKSFRNLTTEDGLASNQVNAIHQCSDGIMWFGTSGGASRYDGKEFINFTTKDGLASNHVNKVYSDRSGVLWFGTEDCGISLYDGKEFVSFTTQDGLPSNDVSSICQDSEGKIWFGTAEGVSCFDGIKFVNFTKKDGLIDNITRCIYCDTDDVLWFGTHEGVSRY
ncbi:hypothetical protein FJZ33_02080, partial [Candidatus Poribacteria bacterium]|nr:hypothetical protein [Candidatus Poribacteria bacterium]